jgi:hypothetical protein
VDGVNGTLNFCEAMNPANPFQGNVVKTLNSEGYAIDSSIPVSCKTVMFYGSGIGLQAYLDIRRQTQPASYVAKKLGDPVCFEKAGSTPATAWELKSQ